MSAVPEVSQTEALLDAWGRWARRNSGYLGYPIASPIHRLIERQKVFAKQKPTGNAARGRETRSFRPADVEVPPEGIVAVDAAVSRLPKHIHAVIWRSYRYGQPDRIGARELRISRQEFTARRLAGIEAVERHLNRCQLVHPTDLR